MNFGTIPASRRLSAVIVDFASNFSESEIEALSQGELRLQDKRWLSIAWRKPAKETDPSFWLANAQPSCGAKCAMYSERLARRLSLARPPETLFSLRLGASLAAT